MSAPRLSLIISTYNRPDALAKVLAGVERQSRRPDEVLIADDGSKEPTRALIADWTKRQSFPVRHVWHQDDGFRKTAILNQSVAVAQGEYLIFLDGDCVPHRRFVADHAALAERGFWVQGRRCFVEEKFVADFEPGQTSIWGWVTTGKVTGRGKAFRLPFPIVRRDTAQRGIIGCNIAAWRDDVIAINGFDEEYSGWGIGEDSDMGTRLYHLGRPRKFVYAHAIVYHLNHPMAPRGHVAESLARLDETIRSRKLRCAAGINLHL
ncbi:MAG: glycosyl transferase family 2 [Pedosphaera sp.]|nr:glycosyl transferase family 2 [Pedosphaera sp.]